MTERVSKFIGFLLAMFGLYELFTTISQKTGNTYIAFVIATVLVSLWLVYEFIRYIYNPFVFRFFRAKPITDGLITNIKIELYIDELGNAISHSWRTYVFQKIPKKWDTYDTLFVKGEFLENIEAYYESNDAIATSYKKLSKNKILVFWKPKDSKIKPNIPYIHHYIYKPPTNFSDNKNFYLLYKICPVGKYEFKVHSHRKINQVWAVEISNHHDKIDEEKAEKIILKNKNFSIPQPVILNDGFEWIGESEQFSNPILIFFTYLDDE